MFHCIEVHFWDNELYYISFIIIMRIITILHTSSLKFIFTHLDFKFLFLMWSLSPLDSWYYFHNVNNGLDNTVKWSVQMLHIFIFFILFSPVTHIIGTSEQKLSDFLEFYSELIHHVIGNNVAIYPSSTSHRTYNWIPHYLFRFTNIRHIRKSYFFLHLLFFLWQSEQ